jgi:PAS domain S-box-containing protein
VFEKGSSVFSPDLAITDVEGQVHTVNAIKTPVKDAEGNVTHLVGITRDITDRKRMEEMKDRFIAAARAHWVRSQHS